MLLKRRTRGRRNDARAAGPGGGRVGVDGAQRVGPEEAHAGGTGGRGRRRGDVAGGEGRSGHGVAGRKRGRRGRDGAVQVDGVAALHHGVRSAQVRALIADGGIFEFKVVAALSGRHRAQLLNYLLLCDLPHGKLINVRPEVVEHEFVNTQWRREDRQMFAVNTDRWESTIPGTADLHDNLLAFLRDMGVGLEIGLYEEALVHFFGGLDQVEHDVTVEVSGHQLGVQRMRLIAPGVAFKITGVDHSLNDIETHTRRLLAHADLRAIAWINITMKCATFTTLSK